MDVENLGSGAVTLDSVRLSILVGGIEREDYVILYPDTFRGSGTSTLAGLSADSLLVTIDINGFDPGLATIRGFLYMTGGSGGSLQDEALTTVDVQTPADLAIGQIDPSQDEVSTGQDSLWTASVVVSNTGGSEVVIDSAAVDAALTFSLGSGWQVQRPGALNGGGWSLSGGETDTLIFQINVTGTGNTGLCTLHVALNGIESNTGRVDVQDTQGGNWGTVMLETPAILNILRVDNIALNAPYVNVEQDFPIRVLVQNTGQDAAYDVSVNLTSSGLSIFPLVPPPVISRLAGGDSTSIEVQVQAHSLPNPREEFTAWVEGTAENTGIYMLLSSPDDTTVATIQSAALLSVEDVVPEVSQVLGGQADPWTVKVALRNAGAAGVVIDDPASDDLSFWAGTIYQTDYVVIPPTALMGGGLVLSGGERDTLLYTISSTGYWGGSVEIRATIEGVDANTELALSDSHSAGVQVQSNPAFRILATRVETLSKTEAGNGTVNTDQLFGIVVLVENGLRETIRDVSIQLQNNGASQIGLPSLSIARIAPSQWDSVRFGVTAASLENLGGEMFISSILEATLENSQIPAPIGPALDSTAVVTIQTPAQLSLSMELEKPDGLFSTSQTFTVRASLENSSSSEVDASGRVQLHLPLSYSLDFGGPGDTVQIVPGIPVEWSVIAPSAPQPILPIVAEIYETPNELNTGSPATILQSSDTVFVQTLESELNIDVSISNPPGAVDDTLSTGQQFTVHAVVWGSNVEDVTAQITLPPGYSTLDNTTKSVLSTDVYWVVKAPNNPMSLSYIQVSATGKDALQPDNPVVAPSASNPVTTVARADLALNLSTSDNSVSLGQAFVVTAHVANYGAATAVGQSSVILQILPTGYWTLDSMTQPVVNSTAFWTIHAPTEPSREAVTIRARISSLPLDHNTNDSVYVSQRTDGIAVTTVGGWLSISEVPRPAGLRNQVLPGDNSIWLMGLELVNRGEQGANGIFIQSLSVIVEDSQGLELSPDDVIDGIRALRVSTTGDTAVIDWSFEYGQLLPGQLPDTNPLTIDFTLHDTIPATDTTTIVLLGNIAETSVAVDFGLNIPDGSYIDARDEYSPGLSISVLDATSKEFSDMRSHPVQVIGDEIVEEDADPYVINCPNPFGEPGRELTTIRYYLKENARVVFRIYTLTGALVWSQEYPDSDPRATKGLHYDVFWDGRNDQGQIVLNGVYILVMETGYGEVGRTKIAVVK